MCIYVSSCWIRLGWVNYIISTLFHCTLATDTQINIPFLPYPLHQYMFCQNFTKHLAYSTAVYMFSTIVICYTNYRYLVDCIVIFINSTSSLFLGTQEHYVQINIGVSNGDCKYNPRFLRVRRWPVTNITPILLYPPRSSCWYQMDRKMDRTQWQYHHCQQKNPSPCWKLKSVSPVIKRIHLSSSK